MTHQRRAKGISGTVLNFTPDTPCKTKKEQFLAYTENKQNYINMLNGKLEEIGCLTSHAQADADFLMAKIATELAIFEETVLLGEEKTFWYYYYFTQAKNGKKQIQNNTKRFGIYSKHNLLSAK